MGLFRKQASEQHHQRLFDVLGLLIAPNFRHLIFALTALIAVALVFLFNNNYHRKQMVVGQLKPSQSIVTARASGRFIVSDVFVEIGQAVKAGDPIIALSSVDALSIGNRHYAQTLANLHHQRDTLRAQLKDAEQSQGLRESKLHQQLTQNNQTHQLTQQQHFTLSQRVDLAAKQVKETTVLHRSGHVATEQLNRQQEQHFALKQQLKELKLELTQLKQQRNLLESELLELPLSLRKEQRAVRSNLTAVESQILDLKSQNELVLTASKRGFISNLNVRMDEIIDKGQYLFTLAPVNSELYAELMIPSRAIGFVKPGQKAKLKIDAFPFQEFGVIDAVILKAATNSLPSSSLQGPFQFQEPVYVVTAKLNHQQVSAFSKNHKLQAGMLLSADILLEQRTLTEWLLKPLLSLKG